MKFSAILSVVPSYVVAQSLGSIYCIFKEDNPLKPTCTPMEDPYSVFKSNNCAAHSYKSYAYTFLEAKSNEAFKVCKDGTDYINEDVHMINGGQSYCQYERTGLSYTFVNPVKAVDAQKECTSFFNDTTKEYTGFSIRQEVAPKNICFYGQDNYSDIIDCTTDNYPDVNSGKQCIKYAENKYLRTDNFFVGRMYSENTCTTVIKGLSSKTNRIGHISNINIDIDSAIWISGLETLPAHKAVPGENLCSYSDDTCTTLEACNSYDGCNMIATDKYLKRNPYSNKVELHATDKCDDYTEIIAAATTCTKLGKSPHYVMFSSSNTTSTTTTTTTTTTTQKSTVKSSSTSPVNLSYFTFAVIAIQIFIFH
eukprot:GHVR01181922.1.p1 GENE.GHVR01181922.1~~GHVR01181922.1.p1  ORF type:complete len:366 (+),score=44.43 GHVR01181922.1:54-1151(+)